MRILLIAFTAFTFLACSEDPMVLDIPYDCQDLLKDSADLHPLNQEFTLAMQHAINQGFPGVNVSISNSQGTWIGSAGYADLKDQVLLQTCQPMLVASVTKMFTATLIYQLQESGDISLGDLLSEHLHGEYMDKIQNAKKVTLYQLLNHTSGLYDYLDPITFEFISINKPYNSDSPIDKLKLAYGKKPTHEPGETYAYSNTNYVLLGLLIEAITDKDLDQVMSEMIFEPMNLSSAFMGTKLQPIPEDAPKGYLSIHANDDLIESEFYYHYDLATGDGGIAITMSDLNAFMIGLHSGRLINASNLSDMKHAMELPEDWKGFYHEANGQGLEVYETPYGTAYGHLGGIVGFSSVAWYFPAHDLAISFSVNGVSNLINSHLEDFALELTQIAINN